MQKLFIRNRKGQKVAVVIEVPPPSGGAPPLGGGGFAFVMHGLGGFKESPQTRAVAEVLVESGYTAVTFDTTNTFGESEGRYEEATTTNYYEDLEDVIAWATSPSPSGGALPLGGGQFVLAGFSLGGLCVALYAERYPEKVKGLALIGTVVSGEMSMAGHAQHEEWRKWKETGWRETPSESIPGVMKRLPWSHMEDRLKYDLLAAISPPFKGGDQGVVTTENGGRMTDRLTMPVLLVVGEKDESCPPEHQKILYAALLGPKALHIIPGAPHTFRDPEHLTALKTKFTTWFKQLK